MCFLYGELEVLVPVLGSSLYNFLVIIECIQHAHSHFVILLLVLILQLHVSLLYLNTLKVIV